MTIAGVGYYAWSSQKQAEQRAAIQTIQTVRVTKGNLEKTIRVTGVTAARNYANVIAPILRGPEGGRPLVLLTLAAPGSSVKKGDVLATIDGQSAIDHIDDTQDTVDAAVADVKKRKAEHLIDWENVQQTLKSAKAEAEKARLEASAGEVRTEVERMLLQLSHDEAEARYKQLLADIPNYRERQRAELRILDITLDRHIRHVNRHKSDIVKFQIRTPLNGLVVMQSVYLGRGQMRQVEAGDQIYPGQQFMKVVDTASMQVDATVSQSNIGDFRIGQEAKISLDAFPGLHFSGKIHSIGALAVGGWRQNFYIRNVPVKIAINGSDPRLIPDLSASADVLIGREGDKVIAPLNTLYTQDGKTCVDVKAGQTFERREVQVGLQTGTHAAILAGLSGGEELRVRD